MALLSNYKETLLNLFKKPATIPYPAKPRPLELRTRGHIAIDIPACIFCGICQRKCPTNAIMVSKPQMTWTIERMRCIQCGACTEACPKKCLFMKNEPTSPSIKPVIDVVTGEPKDA